MSEMKLRFESEVIHIPRYVLRRDSEETGLAQVMELNAHKKPPTLVQDTINGYRVMAISSPYEESPSTSKKFSSFAVATSVPASPVELAYMFTYMYEKSLEFLNRGGIVTGILTAILAISTMTGYLSSAVGISATAALTSIFLAFVVERLRLSRK